MPNNPSTHMDKVRSFWDRYVQKLHDLGIKPPFDRWMVVRAEQYIAAHRDRRLAEQSPAEVDAYLADLGRKPGLKGWQFRQAVGAIQILFALVVVDWLNRVDWERWRVSARDQSPELSPPAADTPAPGEGHRPRSWVPTRAAPS